MSGEFQGSDYVAQVRLTTVSDGQPIGNKTVAYTSPSIGSGSAVTGTDGVADYRINASSLSPGASTTVSFRFTEEPANLLQGQSLSISITRPIPSLPGSRFISLNTPSGQFGTSLSLTGQLLDDNNQVLGNKPIYLLLQGQRYGATTDGNGLFTITLPTPAEVGTLAGSVFFDGDSSTSGSNEACTIEVTPADTAINIGFPSIVETGSTYELSQTLVNVNNGDAVTGDVSVSLPFATENIPSNSSKVYNVLATNPGTYTLNVRFAGDSLHAASERSQTVTVNRGPSVLSGANFTITRGTTGRPSFKLLTRTGTPIAGREITLTMPSNATVYRATTNSSGDARFDIATTSNWTRNTRTVTINFAGDSIFRSDSHQVQMTIN